MGWLLPSPKDMSEVYWKKTAETHTKGLVLTPKGLVLTPKEVLVLTSKGWCSPCKGGYRI